VQAAADKGQFEAVIKLVEAGDSWRPKRGQEVVGCATFDLVSSLVNNRPELKVGACVKPWSSCLSLLAYSAVCGKLAHIPCLAVDWVMLFHEVDAA
jgi:hypothetical protein